MDHKVETKFGDVYVRVTEYDHMYVDTGSKEHSKYGDPPNYLTVRGVQYQASFHMYRWSDGHFHLGPEAKSEYERKQYAFIKRSDWMSRKSGQDGASYPTRDLLIENVSFNIDRWARENERLFLLAEVEHCKSAAVSADNDVAEAEKELTKLKQTKWAAWEKHAGAEQALLNYKEVTK